MMLEPGLEFGVAFGGADGHTFYVRTADPRLRYSGLGGGARYCDVIEHVSDARIIP